MGLIDDLEKHGVDVQSGLKRFAGNQAIYEKCIKKFIADPSYKQLEKGFEEDDFKEAFAAAHTLKGVAGNLGLDNLLTTVIPIFEKLHDGNIEEAKTHAEALKTEYNSFVEMLKNYV